VGFYPNYKPPSTPQYCGGPTSPLGKDFFARPQQPPTTIEQLPPREELTTL